MILVFTNARLAVFQNGQKFTIYQLIYVINELVSGKKFTNARSLLSIGLLSPGSTVYRILSIPAQGFYLIGKIQHV